MKLNNKGYLIVEIIVASVIAMGLAYFLLELVIDLKNKNEDYYVNTVLETDKALMTREVMNDISNYKIKSVTSNNVDYVEFVFDIDGEEVTKRITIDNKIFKYGNYDSGYILDEEYYEKTFADELKVTGLSIIDNCYYQTGYDICRNLDDESMKDVTDGLITISIDAKTPYSDYNYGLELNVNYNVKSTKIIFPPSINNISFESITSKGFYVVLDVSSNIDIKKYEYYINGVLQECDSNSNKCFINKTEFPNDSYITVIVENVDGGEATKTKSLVFAWDKYEVVTEIKCVMTKTEEENISKNDHIIYYYNTHCFTPSFTLELINDECYFVLNKSSSWCMSNPEYTINQIHEYGYRYIFLNDGSPLSYSNNYLFKMADEFEYNKFTDTSIDARRVRFNANKEFVKNPGSFIETVTSYNSLEFPNNNEKDGYWYKYVS